MEIVQTGYPSEPRHGVVVRRHQLKLLRDLLVIDERIHGRQRDNQRKGRKRNRLLDGGRGCQSDIKLDIEALLSIRADRDQLGPIHEMIEAYADSSRVQTIRRIEE